MHHLEEDSHEVHMSMAEAEAGADSQLPKSIVSVQSSGGQGAGSTLTAGTER